MAQKTIPLVSVIIPMFNSAKFIPQTLESLLYQTMQDFEVIVVDDCSKDNSVEVVESFKEKFGEKLRLIKFPRNTGMPGLPRNAGIQIARGKYIAFLDSDDLFTKTALEELTALAEEYQADVVHMNDSYRAYKGQMLSVEEPEMTDFDYLTDSENWSVTNWHYPLTVSPKPLEAPALETENLAERVKSFTDWKYRLGVCANFCRRDFLIDNRIFFPKVASAEDQLFNFACLCLAKNYLLAPNIVYIVRPRFGSISREENDENAEKYFRKWIKIFNGGFKALEKFMARNEFFNENPDYRNAVTEFFSICIIDRNITNFFSEEQAEPFYRLLKENFHTEDAELAANFSDMLNNRHLKISELKEMYEEPEKYKARNEKAKDGIPLVSVIIPMFNSAKFIPQTLESLLYQTINDFEVVIVDDCSTDNSVEVAESFTEKFNNRGINLKVVRLPKNTGAPGLPRNVGIQFACGKYISFLDSDDLYTKTALEEITKLAEKYQADVVHLNDTFTTFKGKALPLDDPRLTNMKEITKKENLIRSNWHWTISPTPPEPFPAPIFKPYDLKERVQDWVDWGYRMSVCTIFCRRDFLTANQIFFSKLVANEDQVIVFTCLCLAKKLLRVPNIVYIIVPHWGSQSRDRNLDRNNEKYIHKWLSAINGGFNELNKVMDRFSFFDENPGYRYAVLNWFFTFNVFMNKNLSYDQNKSDIVYPMMKSYFQPDNAPLTAYLLNTVKEFKLRINELEKENKKLKQSQKN